MSVMIPGEQIDHTVDIQRYSGMGRYGDVRHSEPLEEWGIRAKAGAVLAVARGLREIAAAIRGLTAEVRQLRCKESS